MANTESPELVQSDRERIVWLLGFLRRNVESLRSGELLDLFNDAFTCLHSDHAAATVEIGATQPSKRLFKAGLHGSDVFTRISGAEARKVVSDAGVVLTRLQELCRTGTEALKDKSEWQPLPDGAPLAWVYKIGADGTVSRLYKGDPMRLILASAADLLARWWPELRECKYEECRALFLPRDGRQRYHDPECSRQRRWKEFEPKRKGKRDYAAEHKQRNREKYGAKTRIGSREKGADGKGGKR